MSRITFGRTAYVAGTPADILDGIEREMSASMTGDGLVCVDWDEMPEGLPVDGDSKVESFLKAARQDIQVQSEEGQHIGDVVFVH